MTENMLGQLSNVAVSLVVVEGDSCILAQKCVTFGPSTKCLNEFFPFCLVPPLDPETLGGLGLGPLPLG